MVVATRRIGDVLLITPVLRSLRHAYPSARIDVVVFRGTEGCISANRDIDQIIAVADGAPFRERVGTICRLFRRYDLAISMLSGDRPVFYAWLAGKSSLGPVENGYKHLWKRVLLDQYELFDNYDTHTVTMNLSLLSSLGIQQIPEVSPAWENSDEMQVRQLLPFDMDKEPYALVHIYPKFSYKMWHREGWTKLICWLKSRGFRAVLTGSSENEELEYIARLCPSLPPDIINVAGALTLSGVAYLLSKASVYIGLDTSVTHMAAALGIPTIALYGPTNPVKWGPMPGNVSFQGKSPYHRKGSQIIGNVFLLQGKGDCVPCHEEGCDRHIKSLSKCLQAIEVEEVMEAVELMMTRKASGGGK